MPMNEKNNSIMIKNILTLRYDPSLETSRNKFTWNDFEVQEFPQLPFLRTSQVS